MMIRKYGWLLMLGWLAMGCRTAPKEDAENDKFPAELVSFSPYDGNPVFEGSKDSTFWDEKIRERGFILKEDSTFYLWYTGYNRQTGKKIKYLGFATSPDGFKWTRHAANPIHRGLWVEDMFVLKEDSTYYMFAESRGDSAHLLTSTDRINWSDQGALNIRKKNGEAVEAGPYGTPAVWKENDIWYLFYERNDAAAWLATSKDLKVWTNIQDEPVLKCGPEAYDKFAVAINQIIKYKGLYYAYYHASAFKDWREWSTNIAVSSDLIHWEKYGKNPVIEDNTSSGIVVPDGAKIRLYTMHPEVRAYLPGK